LNRTDRITDAQIRCGARNVLARHWIDVHLVDIGAFRGVVRLRGELRHQGRSRSEPVGAEELQGIELELKRLRGVHRVHLCLENWHHTESGEWRETRRTRGKELAEVPAPTEASLDAE